MPTLRGVNAVASLRSLRRRRTRGAGPIRRSPFRSGDVASVRPGALAAVGLLLCAIFVPASIGTLAGDHGSATAGRAPSVILAKSPVAHRGKATLDNTQICNGVPQPQFSGGTGFGHTDHFLSDYVGAPVTGAADVPNADFTNIFLFPDGGDASFTWDDFQAVEASHGVTIPSQEDIDAMTTSLVCSSYFDLLTQYNINPPIYSGDENTIPSCVTNALKDAATSPNGVMEFATMRSFAGCEDSSAVNANTSPQVNIFVAPPITASAYGQDGDAMCSPATTTNAYHGAGLNVPNLAVIPVDPACFNGPGLDVLESLSHEMAETITDPFGLGWIHSSGPTQFTQDYGQGEVADICENSGELGGLHPTAPAPFPNVTSATGDVITGLTVGPYWSDQDDQCENPFIMNTTIIPLGTPGTSGDLSGHGSITVPTNTGGEGAFEVNSLELEVTTGNDNLNGGSSANVDLSVNELTTKGMKSIDYQDFGLNEGAEWGNGTLHAVLLNFPSGVTLDNITQLKLSGDLPNDTWDVTGIRLLASVSPVSGSGCSSEGPAEVLDIPQGKTVLSDGSKGLTRFVGDVSQSFPETLAIPSVDDDLQITSLDLTVDTGKADLRAGNDPGDNASAVLDLTNGIDVGFPNVNQNDNWPADQPQPVSLLSFDSLPPDTTAGELSSLSITADLPGGLSGSNWDLAGLSLSVSVGCPATTPAPVLSTVNLLDDVGSTTLPDGHTGICLLSGSNHTCPILIPNPGALYDDDQVYGFEFTIGTGADNLNGGSLLGDNATVQIDNSTQPNLNESDDWGNWTDNSFPVFQLASTTSTIGSITSLNIVTDFTGVFPDNWDLYSVQITALVVEDST